MNMGKKQGHSRKHAKSFVEILSIKLRETFERYLDSSATLSTNVRPCPKKSTSQRLNAHHKQCNAPCKTFGNIATWQWEISWWSVGWTNHLYFNLTLVRGTSKRNKGINCCIDSCKLQSFCLMLEWEKWWNTTLHSSTWPIHTGFSTRTMQSNTWKEHIRMTGCLFNTCCITQKVRCWGGNRQKGTAKEQGHGRKTYKVFSLNPLSLSTNVRPCPKKST